MEEPPFTLEEAAPPAAPAAAPAPAEGAGPRAFGPLPRALAQRRALLWALKGLALACVLLLALAFQPPLPWLNALKWVLVGAVSWGLWQAEGAAFSAPLLEREVLLHPHALEIRRNGFKRLVVFENIQHLHLQQAVNGRLLCLRLDLEDDSVSLRDVDGLAAIFEAAAQGRPAKAFIEIEERRLDWGEPLPWAALALGVCLLLAFFATLGWGQEDYLRADGRLLLLNALCLGAWRPLSRGHGWQVKGAEIGCVVLMASLGWAMAG